MPRDSAWFGCADPTSCFSPPNWRGHATGWPRHARCSSAEGPRIHRVAGDERTRVITAMTHAGFYIDDQQPPRAGCAAYSVGLPAVPAPNLLKLASCKSSRSRARTRCLRTQRRARKVNAQRLAAARAAQFDPLKGVLSHGWGTPEAKAISEPSGESAGVASAGLGLTG